MRWQCYGLGRRDSGGCVGRYGLGFRVTLELPRVLFDLINQRSPRIFTSIISLWLYFLSILFYLLSFYIFFYPVELLAFYPPSTFCLSFSLSIPLFHYISLFCFSFHIFVLVYSPTLSISYSLIPSLCFLSLCLLFQCFSPPFLIVFAFLPSLRVFSQICFYCNSLILLLPSHFQTFYQMNVCMLPMNA